MKQEFAIGIDIGGTNTSFGIVDRRGQILGRGNMPTAGYKTVSEYIRAIGELLQPYIDKIGSRNIIGAGVGAPNGNFYTGEIAHAANLPWKGVIPLAKLLNDELNMKVTITNDANAAAVGEMMYGVAKGMKDFIFVTLGTGVGSGFVANGQLIYGHDGFAGELGHVIAVRNGRDCGCGRKGCMERYCSATGIVHTAKLWLKEKSDYSLLRNVEELTARSIYDAAEEGDKIALEIFEYTGMILGQTLADAVAITSPQAIILFGGLANAGKYVLEPTQKYMEDNLLNIYKNKVQVLQSMLPGNDAAVLGASALVW